MEDTKKKCPYCGEEILAEAKKCKYCGEWLPEREKDIQERISCPVCGEMIGGDVEVCPYCGEKTGNGIPVSMTNEPHGDSVDEAVSEPVPESEVKEDSGNRFEEEEDYDDTMAFNDEGRPLGFIEYFINEPLLKHYADFKGKASRKQFWCFQISVNLFLSIFFFMMSLIMGDTDSDLYSICLTILSLLSLAFFIPSLAITARRLNDIGKSPWLMLLALVPIANFYLLYLACVKGETVCKKIKVNAQDWIIPGALILVFGVLAYENSLMDDSDETGEVYTKDVDALGSNPDDSLAVDYMEMDDPVATDNSQEAEGEISVISDEDWANMVEICSTPDEMMYFYLKRSEGHYGNDYFCPEVYVSDGKYLSKLSPTYYIGAFIDYKVIESKGCIYFTGTSDIHGDYGVMEVLSIHYLDLSTLEFHECWSGEYSEPFEIQGNRIIYGDKYIELE